MKEEIKNKIIHFFEFEDTPKARKAVSHRIKVGGRFIKLGAKNKTVWPSIGAAKSALSCHCKSIIARTILEDSGKPFDSEIYGKGFYYSRTEEKAWQTFLKLSIENKFIEFIPLSE